MATEPKSTVFDFERYGVFLRTARQRAGFNRAEEFCRVVTNWIGVKINKEALYRIEKGVQPPTVEQLIAFGLVLFHGKGINSVLNKTDLHHCTTPYADFIAEREGSIYSMMTYNGYHAVDNPGNEDEPFWEPIMPDELGSDVIDEYYYDQLYGRHEDPKPETDDDSPFDDSLPDTVVNIDGTLVDLA